MSENELVATVATNYSNVSSVTIGERKEVLVIIETTLIILLDVFAFTGNLLVCLSLYRTPSLRTVTNVFVFSLALTDFLMSVLVIPLKAAASIANRRFFGDLGCEIAGITAYSLAGVSLVTLTMIAVNRYIRMVKPSLYPTIYTVKTAAVMSSMAWCVPLALGAIAFFVLGVKFENRADIPEKCRIVYATGTAKMFYTAVITSANVPTSLVIVTCYALVFRKIREHNNTMKTTGKTKSSPKAPRGIKELKMTKMFAAVLVGFYLCWIPPFITNVLNAFRTIPPGVRLYSTFYQLLPLYTSSMINPVIYASMNSQFRAAFLKVLGFKERRVAVSGS